MTKPDLGSPSTIQDSTYQQNREDARIIQLKEELNALNLQIEAVKKKIKEKTKGG